MQLSPAQQPDQPDPRRQRVDRAAGPGPHRPPVPAGAAQPGGQPLHPAARGGGEAVGLPALRHQLVPGAQGPGRCPGRG